MNDYEEFQMNVFETFSFTRLVRAQNFEFYFILGINEAHNFNEVWDGRLIEVVGYLVMYSPTEKDKEINYIYLIEDKSKNYQDIILHTKMFTSDMYTYLDGFDREEGFIIKKTNIYQRGLLKQDIDRFVRSIVNEDIPEIDLTHIMQ